MSDDRNAWNDPIPDPSFDDLKQILTLLVQPDIQYAILSNVLTRMDNSKITDEIRIARKDHLATAFNGLESWNRSTVRVTITKFSHSEDVDVPSLTSKDILRICEHSTVRVHEILEAMPSHLAPDKDALNRVRNYFLRASTGPRIIELTANKVQNLPEDF